VENVSRKENKETASAKATYRGRGGGGFFFVFCMVTNKDGHSPHCSYYLLGVNCIERRGTDGDFLAIENGQQNHHPIAQRHCGNCGRDGCHPSYLVDQRKTSFEGILLGLLFA
jgi:hypothetical protein